MRNSKVIYRMLLVCVCVTLAVCCLELQALAVSTIFKNGKIEVALAADDEFTYYELLDLSASTKDVPLLDMEVDPSTVGTADATRIKIRFTDLYDEDNYITISLNNIAEDWADGHIYVTAGAAHQPQVGIENAGNPDSMKVYVNDAYGYGAAVDFSMVGLPKTSEDSHLTLYFDYEEKAIYADRETYTHTKQLVVDLDEAAYFGDNLWEGFTTGQVKMSVSGYNYQAATCNLIFSTINGKSGFEDTGDVNPPVILVHTGYEPEQLPTALVGKPYPVFPAEAIDGNDGRMEAAASVYYGYDTEAPVEVPVQDGEFTPLQSGTYVIEYTAKDKAGNVATETISVSAIQSDGLQVTLLDMAAGTNTGVAVQLISGISYTDASGNVSYTVQAESLETGDKVDVDSQTHSFTPMRAGAWEITVTVKDYVSTVVKTFVVTANPTTQPQVYDTVSVPDYFIVDATYELPVLYGYDFSSGKGVLTAMDVYVTEDGSSETKLTDGQYVPANAGSVTVTYRLTVDGKSCEKSYTATVVNVKTMLGTVSLSRYFVDPTGAATATSASSKITYTFSKDTRLNFVNYVQVKQLTFSFQVGSKNAYNKISVYLTDPASGKQVKLSYNRTDNGVTFSVNDGGEMVLSSAFSDAFWLSFSNDTGVVIPETGTQIKVKKFLDGSDFTGFTEGVAKFTVELSGVSGSSQLVITNLNGQKMNYATKDSVAPQFFAGTVSGTWEQGETLRLKGAFVHDVLDPVATVTLKVTDPDGTSVTDESGIVLNGTQDATKDTAFTMDKLGTYTVFYTVTDGKKNTGRYIYTVTAVDGEGPTITLLDHIESVKSGETVAIAGVEVTDNITENCTVVYYVFDPEGVNMAVADGSFEAAIPGIYTVRYMAWDDDGNYAFISYKVTAQEEQEKPASYMSQSLSLGSDLVLHLWGNVPEEYVNSISGTLTYDDAVEEFNLSQLTPDANGLYHMQAEMAVAQMTDDVELVLKHNIIGQAIYKTYSIRDYLVALIESDCDRETKELCMELLNMGTMAQQYFQTNTEDLANKGYEIIPGNAVPSQIPEVPVSGSVSGIRFYGTSVRFLSQTAVRFYFKADGAVDGYTFTIDGAEYVPGQKDGLYYIETPGINPQNMSDEITVVVTNGTDTLSVTYAPMWYFIRSYNKSDNETTRNLMEAAYSYYKETEEYVGAEVTPNTGNLPENPTGEGVYICMDVLITTLGNSTENIDLGFYPHDFEGDINSHTDKIAVTAGTTTTVKLNAEKYMVDGVIPDGLGIVVFGGPEWDDKLSDGYTPDRHTLVISNARLEGDCENTLDLRTASVSSGTNGTGYTNANGSGTACLDGESIVITGGFRYDGHKITLGDPGLKERTYISMDILITTLGNSIEPLEVRFYPQNFAGNVHTEYTEKVLVTAGTTTTVKLALDHYLVDGELPGIGFAVFSGPEWNTQLSSGVYDRHTIIVSNMHLEGGLEQTIDLSKASVTTGFGGSNSGGTASIADGTIVITNGFRYDGHMIIFVA